jgi:predicted transcriptional regulator of viral defense system
MPRRAKISHISGRRFQPVLESASTIAIGAQEAGHGAKVSNKERALLESASRPSLVGGWTTLATALNQSSYDPETLRQLAEQLNAGVALRRIASLADVTGVDDWSAALAPPPSNARLVLLDPQEAEEEPWTDLRWRVRWPTSRQQARELIAN